MKNKFKNAVILIVGTLFLGACGDVDSTLGPDANTSFDSDSNSSSGENILLIEEENTDTDNINAVKIQIGARNVKGTPLSLATKFASPDGSGDGTIGSPYPLVEALNSLVAGDVLFLRGGIYDIPTTALRISFKIGTLTDPIIIESYPTEVAILDGKNRTAQDVIDGGHPTSQGFYFRESEYVYLRKIEVRGMSKTGITLTGRHNKVQGCHIHSNFLSGIHILDSNGYKTPYEDGWNVIEDNIIHDNSDADISGKGGHDSGNNADGVSIAQGQFNTIRNNTISTNSDDGIDTWRSNDTLVEYNLVDNNGRGMKGNGNGIKMGGNDDPGSTNGLRTIARNNISFNNKAVGFDQNSGKDIQVYNNTAYSNGGSGFSIGSAISVVNNISYLDFKTDSNPESETRINNSWQQIEDLEFITTNPSEKNFLMLINSNLNIGAYFEK